MTKPRRLALLGGQLLQVVLVTKNIFLKRKRRRDE